MRIEVLDVRLPAGPDYYWQRACEFGEAGFTAHELWFTTRGVARSTVRIWLERMVKIEAIAIVGMRFEARQPHPPRVYAVVRPTSQPPVDADRGYGQAQQQLWTAMRTLAQFTVTELAAAASTDALTISRSTAQKWVSRLAAAEIVVAVRKGRNAKRDSAVWRLRPAANTGPLAPKRYRAAFFFDPNQKVVIGPSEAEEVRP